MMTIQEIARGDGTVEVQVGERRLACTVCGHQQFHERNSMLNTRVATFFRVDWANKEATNYICAECGYIFWFVEGR
jgi:DNA-directed RNA polymerase subunit RPC12/RpoP